MIIKKLNKKTRPASNKLTVGPLSRSENHIFPHPLQNDSISLPRRPHFPKPVITYTLNEREETVHKNKKPPIGIATIYILYVCTCNKSRNLETRDHWNLWPYMELELMETNPWMTGRAKQCS
jgi:hypothetical protein